MRLIKLSVAMLALSLGAGSAVATSLSSESDVRAKTVPMLKMNNGAEMPQFGLGTYQISDGENAYNAVLTALRNGYRHIDTAHAYEEITRWFSGYKLID